MKKILTAAALAIGFGAASASASTFDVNAQPTGIFGTVGFEKVKVSLLANEVQAGMFHLNGNNGVGDFVAFCVELTQFLNLPQSVTVSPSPFSAAKTASILKMFDGAMMGATMEATFNTAIKAAGFQLALWEVVYETGASYDLTAGSFTGFGTSATNGAAVDAQAASYLSGIAGGDENDVTARWLLNPNQQDLVTVAPVPLPAAGLLLALGIAGLGFAGRRKSA